MNKRKHTVKHHVEIVADKLCLVIVFVALMELQIPTGLTDMLQEFTVVVLRERPDDMVDFAADYFTQLKLLNKASGNTKGVSFHSDEKASDEEDDEEEPLGS